MDDEAVDVAVVGAGVGGLQCARTLASVGMQVTVLEKARGVGGRVATRRVQGQPYDKGPVCLHGRDQGFLEAVRATVGLRLEGWPRVMYGTGDPPVAAVRREGEERHSFVEGLTRFPKFLAQGLDVRLEHRVERLEEADGHLIVHGPRVIRARAVVLSAPIEQSRALLDSLPRTGRSIRLAWRGLSQLHTDPCLSLAAFYAPGVPEPLFDVLYPADDPALWLVSQDHRKRRGQGRPVLVAQAHPAWSREHLEEAPETWAPLLLGHVAEHVGRWALEPVELDTHRWRYAVERPSTPQQPVVLTLAGGGVVGVTGPHFAPGEGVAAAWRAGETLARRLLATLR